MATKRSCNASQIIYRGFIQPIVYGIRALIDLIKRCLFSFQNFLSPIISETTNSPATTTETIAVSATSSILNVNMKNVTKLTGSNFLMWSRQVHALLDGYDLADYIEGFIVVPSATITSEDGITTNPTYTLWKRQDRLIYSSLLSAITPTI